MNPVLAIGRARLRAARNTLLLDARMRLALLFYLIISVSGGIWGTFQLRNALYTWQHLSFSVLIHNLWFLCIAIWLSIGIFSLLYLRQALTNDHALLVYSIPLPARTRFRILLSLFLLENIGSLFIIQAVMTLCAFVLVLGWQALSWFLLLQVGIILNVYLTILIGLLLTRYLLVDERSKTRIFILIGSCCLITLIIMLLLVFGLHLDVRWPQPGVPLFWSTLMLVLLLGPGAECAGKVYIAALQTIQSWDRGQKTFTIPGVPLLVRVLEQRRTLTAAFFARALHNQSRNPFFWLRLLMIWIAALIGFPLLCPFILRLPLSSMQILIILAAGLAVAHLLEPGVCAISGEGSRFALYLASPFSLNTILRARLLVCLLPLLLETLLLSLSLNMQLHLSLGEFALAMLAVTLIVVGSTTFLVLGSAWDLDLNERVEGPLQALLLEEVPLSPRRMFLFMIGLIYTMGIFFMFWYSTLLPVLFLLFFTTIGISMGMWWFALRSIRQAVI